MKHVRIFL